MLLMMEKVIRDKIIKLTHTKLKGKYDCNTVDGTLIVDNIFCSSHDTHLPHWFANCWWSFLQSRPFMYKLCFKYVYTKFFI